MVVPSPPFSPGPRPEMEPLSKESLRRAALDARKAFVRTLSGRRPRAARAAACRTSDFALRRSCGGRRLLPARHPRSARCRRPKKRARSARSSPIPAFANPAKPFRFLAGDPLEPGPFGMMQPQGATRSVEPDLVLVPLIAVDGHGTRLGRGKGHYDRALSPEEERRAADRRRLADSAPDQTIPGRRVGRAARCLRLTRRRGVVSERP